MPDLDTFVIFTCAVALLLVSPGPNMAFVIGHGFHMAGVAVSRPRWASAWRTRS